MKQRILMIGLALLFSGGLAAQEKITLTGMIQPAACVAACGTCCGSHVITDRSGSIALVVGNSFVDLAKFVDDSDYHPVTGRFYEAPGQCGVGICSLFLVETLDTNSISEPGFDPASATLSIESVVINNNERPRYRVTLSAPFNLGAVAEIEAVEKVSQGGDCSAQSTECEAGSQCLSWYGIAGPNGPEFQTCEIPCSHPGATCPRGQSCATINDGPGLVCVVRDGQPVPLP